MFGLPTVSNGSTTLEKCTHHRVERWLIVMCNIAICTHQNINGLNGLSRWISKTGKERERATKCLQRHSIGQGVITSYRSKEIKLYIRQKGYIMMSRSMVNMKKGRTSIVQRSFLQTDKDFLNNKQ
jgi:hypothetical protein